MTTIGENSVTRKGQTFSAWARICLELAPVTALATSSPSQAHDAWLSRSSLCVTEGSLKQAQNSEVSVNVPKMRAYVDHETTDFAELRFTYLGATATQVPLASGANRQQLGLKLRAADACNLVYVMWRIQPTSVLVVSVKRNDGQHSSSECSNHGYHDLHAEFSSPLPPLKPGDTHSLRARIDADELRAFVDGRLVWRGHLQSAVAGLSGPVGIRTDNARLSFKLGVENVPGRNDSATGTRCTLTPE